MADDKRLESTCSKCGHYQSPRAFYCHICHFVFDESKVTRITTALVITITLLIALVVLWASG